jgi:D-methionine transport system ATP-binding protein
LSPTIEIAEVSKQFKGHAALEGVNLSIHSGDIYGIIGLSGAGKSTLIRLLAGLETPTTGSIRIEGENIGKLDKKSLRFFRKNIGMIFQHFNLLSSRTVQENIAYPLEILGLEKSIQDERIDELLRLVNLSTKKNAYPSQLSGGEKQRVGIARALATKPKILLCDEATSALDPKTTKEILELLKSIHKRSGLTIVLITHEMEVIKRLCNKVAVLDHGTIVEKGLVSEIFSDPKQLITKQFINSTTHELPEEFFKLLSPNRKLLRLIFKGKEAKEPIISHMMKNFHVEANILQGWIDNLQTVTIGTLIIELIGDQDNIQRAFSYLTDRGVHYEVLEHGS